MSTANPVLKRHLGTLVLIAALVLFSIGKAIVAPIVLAALLAALLTPAVRWLVRHRLPDLLAVGIVVGSLTLAVLLLGSVVANQLDQVVDKLVEYRHNIHERLGELTVGNGTVSKAASTIHALQADLGDLASAHGLPVGGETPAHQSTEISTTSPVKVDVVTDHRIGIGDLLPLLSTSLEPLAIFGLTFLLGTFMIVQRADLARRFTLLAAWMAARDISIFDSEALVGITDRISRYLVFQTALNFGAGSVIAAVLYFLGVPNALLWGLLTALLRYIPYLGIVIAASLTVLFSIAVSANWSVPLQVMCLFLALELVLGNVIEPLVLGHGTGLSSLGVLVATAFWTWIWGPMGLFLAIPLTVCLVAIGRQAPSLAYLEILLADPMPALRPEKPTSARA